MYINQKAWIAPDATIRGNVDIEQNVSVWFQTVIRSEHAKVTIKENSNIQDRCVIHTDENYDTVIEKGCTIGHGAILHGCHVGENSLIGMGSIVLNGASIGKNSMVGAGSLVTQNKHFEDGMLIMGTPAKAIRPLTSEEIEANRKSASEYVELSKQYEENVW